MKRYIELEFCNSQFTLHCWVPLLGIVGCCCIVWWYETLLGVVGHCWVQLDIISCCLKPSLMDQQVLSSATMATHRLPLAMSLVLIHLHECGDIMKSKAKTRSDLACFARMEPNLLQNVCGHGWYHTQLNLLATAWVLPASTCHYLGTACQ